MSNTSGEAKHKAMTILVGPGDLLQSSASRLAEWVLSDSAEPPYEVQMAALEAQAAVNEWTEARQLLGDNEEE